MNGQPIVVNLEGTSILDKIQEQFGISTIDILRAIAIKSVGHKHVELFGVKTLAAGSPKALSDNLKPILPNSRMLVMFQLSWAATEPNISWQKIKGNNTANGNVLSTLNGSKVTGSDYQFDEPVTRGTEYNLITSQDCTFDYIIVIEYAIGF